MPVAACISSAVANEAFDTPISLRTRLFTSSWVWASTTQAANRLGSFLEGDNNRVARLAEGVAVLLAEHDRIGIGRVNANQLIGHPELLHHADNVLIWHENFHFSPDTALDRSIYQHPE